ncbi:MAG: hypothetical protein NTZ67_03960 [Gammaproteobacteria bacterium]|nr:hypothetical protein [Gammaproteobacteria bacterium]
MKNFVRIASLLVLTAALGLTSSAMAQQASPYAYIYSLYGGTQVSEVTLDKVDIISSNTQASLPSLPAEISSNNNQEGLVTAYATTASEQALSVVLHYTVTAGIGPTKCDVTVSTPSIPNKNQPLNAVISNGCSATVLFNPVYSVNPADGDQVVTINWKLQ